MGTYAPGSAVGRAGGPGHHATEWAHHDAEVKKRAGGAAGGGPIPLMGKHLCGAGRWIMLTESASTTTLPASSEHAAARRLPCLIAVPIMIEIDGSYGEGGGAILRQALGLAVYAAKPVRIRKIRTGRRKAGLAAQHLKAVEAAGAICGARVQGANLGSTELVFDPGPVRPGRVSVDVGTAGSVTLVLQAVLLPCLFLPGEFEFELTGGTDVPWSPPADYLANVTLRTLQPFGIGRLEVVRRGYYPKGGGLLRARLEGGSGFGFALKFPAPGDVKVIRGVSHATVPLKERGVAERQADAAEHLLQRLGSPVEIAVEYSDAANLGSGVTLWTESDDGPPIGGSALGAKGKAADDVGREAARALLNEFNAGAAVDHHLADQLIPFLAVSGGSLVTSGITAHTRSTVYVAEQILGTEFAVEGLAITAER